MRKPLSLKRSWPHGLKPPSRTRICRTEHDERRKEGWTSCEQMMELMADFSLLVFRHAGLDPASTFFAAVAKGKGGPRIKSGVTGVGDQVRMCGISVC